MESLFGDILSIWKPWTVELTGGSIDSGHHIAEDAPTELAARLNRFLNPSVID